MEDKMIKLVKDALATADKANKTIDLYKERLEEYEEEISDLKNRLNNRKKMMLNLLEKNKNLEQKVENCESFSESRRKEIIKNDKIIMDLTNRVKELESIWEHNPEFINHVNKIVGGYTNVNVDHGETIHVMTNLMIVECCEAKNWKSGVAQLKYVTHLAKEKNLAEGRMPLLVLFDEDNSLNELLPTIRDFCNSEGIQTFYLNDVELEKVTNGCVESINKFDGSDVLEFFNKIFDSERSTNIKRQSDITDLDDLDDDSSN